MAKYRETSTAVGVDLTKALSHGSSGIRKKMRDISRLLKRDNLAADIRIANERALKTLQLELNKVGEDQKEKKLAIKYHKVRFFEKKKAKRFYLQNKKKVESLESKLKDENINEEESKNLKKELKKLKRVLEHCSVDLAYVLNFPKNEKYISLYVNNNESTKDKLDEKTRNGLRKTNEKRNEYKKLFADQLKNGTLGISLEEEFNIKTENNNSGNSNNSNNKKVKGRSKVPTENIDDAEKINEDNEEKDDFFE